MRTALCNKPRAGRQRVRYLTNLRYLKIYYLKNDEYRREKKITTSKPCVVFSSLTRSIIHLQRIHRLFQSRSYSGSWNVALPERVVFLTGVILFSVAVHRFVSMTKVNAQSSEPSPFFALILQ